MTENQGIGNAESPRCVLRPTFSTSLPYGGKADGFAAGPGGSTRGKRLGSRCRCSIGSGRSAQSPTSSTKVGSAHHNNRDSELFEAFMSVAVADFRGCVTAKACCEELETASTADVNSTVARSHTKLFLPTFSNLEQQFLNARPIPHFEPV